MRRALLTVLALRAMTSHPPGPGTQSTVADPARSTASPPLTATAGPWHPVEASSGDGSHGELPSRTRAPASPRSDRREQSSSWIIIRMYPVVAAVNASWPSVLIAVAKKLSKLRKRGAAAATSAGTHRGGRVPGDAQDDLPRHGGADSALRAGEVPVSFAALAARARLSGVCLPIVRWIPTSSPLALSCLVSQSGGQLRHHDHGPSR